MIVATPNLSLIDMFPGRVWVCEDEKSTEIDNEVKIIEIQE